MILSPREQQVVALLRSRFDWLPGPRTSTGQIVRGARRGESRRPVACPRCSGEGELGGKVCARCGGSGRVLADPMLVDEKTAVAALGGVRRFEGVRARDREIARLEGLARLRDGQSDPREREPWERAKDALWGSGSFRELERCLAELERDRPRLRAAVELAFGADADLRELGPNLRRKVVAGVSRLAECMPREIRVPERDELARVRALRNGKSKQHADARAARDSEIRRQRDAGWSVQEICHQHGLGRSRVFEILAEQQLEEAS